MHYTIYTDPICLQYISSKTTHARVCWCSWCFLSLWAILDHARLLFTIAPLLCPLRISAAVHQRNRRDTTKTGSSIASASLTRADGPPVVVSPKTLRIRHLSPNRPTGKENIQTYNQSSYGSVLVASPALAGCRLSHVVIRCEQCTQVYPCCKSYISAVFQDLLTTVPLALVVQVRWARVVYVLWWSRQGVHLVTSRNGRGTNGCCWI